MSLTPLETPDPVSPVASSPNRPIARISPPDQKLTFWQSFHPHPQGFGFAALGELPMDWEGPYDGEMGGIAYIVGSHVWESIDGGQTWILSKFLDDYCACDEIAVPA